MNDISSTNFQDVPYQTYIFCGVREDQHIYFTHSIHVFVTFHLSNVKHISSNLNCHNLILQATKMSPKPPKKRVATFRGNFWNQKWRGSLSSTAKERISHSNERTDLAQLQSSCWILEGNGIAMQQPYVHLAISHNMYQSDHTVHRLSSCTTPKKFVWAKVYKKNKLSNLQISTKRYHDFSPTSIFSEKIPPMIHLKMSFLGIGYITVLGWSCRRWCLEVDSFLKEYMSCHHLEFPQMEKELNE